MIEEQTIRQTKGFLMLKLPLAEYAFGVLEVPPWRQVSGSHKVR